MRDLLSAARLRQHMRPVALRPRLTRGLPLSQHLGASVQHVQLSPQGPQRISLKWMIFETFSVGELPRTPLRRSSRLRESPRPAGPIGPGDPLPAGQGLGHRRGAMRRTGPQERSENAGKGGGSGPTIRFTRLLPRSELLCASNLEHRASPSSPFYMRPAGSQIHQKRRRPLRAGPIGPGPPAGWLCSGRHYRFLM